MKTRYFKIAGIAAAALVGFASCQDFLEEKKNFDAVGPALYNDWDGVLGRLSDTYQFSMPRAEGDGGDWRYPSLGHNNNTDWAVKCTEEYSGFTNSFVNPQAIFAPDQSAPDYFQGDRTNVQNGVWGVIRNINDAIEGVKGGSLPQERKDEALGQLYILRAWRYFMVWKWYGGVPIITVPQPIQESSVTPRSTSKEVFDFIINDLNTAAELLEPFTGNGQWMTGSNYGRLTTGAALALKSRVLAWWCSPLFNRAQDVKRYEYAYNEIQGDLAKINACGYKFMHSDVDGWADMFNVLGGNSEAVFFTRHNDQVSGNTPDYHLNNRWESRIRPSNAQGGGGQNPSTMIINLFPMADGKLPAGQGSSLLPHSGDAYDPQFPFLNRDPRFYRTFAFPGMEWKFNGTAMADDSRNPYNGDNYELWNYVWYEKADQKIRTNGNNIGADNLLENAKGVYVTKRSAATPSKGAYTWPTASGAKGFELGFASFIEIRYAEVLLNMAEIACGAGQTGEAYQYLRDIRTNAGYSGDCGIVEGNQAACFAAILYERQIELAFEGKRFDDMRRWLLFDGGANMSQVQGAPSSWTVTGWGGNTCSYLGVQPLNGHRRENMEYRVADAVNNGLGSTKWDSWNDMPDPIATTLLGNGTVSLPSTEPADDTKDTYKWVAFRDWRSQFAVDLSDRTNLQDNLKKLKEGFYDKYLTWMEKRGDGTDSNQNELAPYFPPHCYFLGFSNGVQSYNPTLPNNIGWGNGTFDPLAE